MTKRFQKRSKKKKRCVVMSFTMGNGQRERSTKYKKKNEIDLGGEMYEKQAEMVMCI